MKPVNLLLYASAIFLMATAIAGAYFYDSESMGAEYPWVPARFLNRTSTGTQWGDLTQFDVRVNCTMNHTASAPVISYRNTQMTEQELRTIAAEIFGMKSPELDSDDPSDISLLQAHKEIRFYKQKIVYGAEVYEEPAVRGNWNETEVRRIADEVIGSLEPYWELPTDAVRRVSSIGPSGWENGDKWITSFSVLYTWSVQGIEVVGSGCSVTVNHRGWLERVAYTKPVVYVTGEQRVTVTPEEALAEFTGGRSINSVLGVPKLRCGTLDDGTVVIDDVRLVYYPIKSDEGDVAEVLVYRIEFRMFEGESTDGEPYLTSVEYEYAN